MDPSPEVAELLRLSLLHPEMSEYLDRNEQGDADLFARLFTGQAIFDHAAGLWYLWDGRHWNPDRQSEIYDFVGTRLAAEYLTEADDAGGHQGRTASPADVSRREARQLAARFTSRGHALLNLGRMRNVLELASALPGIALTGDEWDVPPMVLPVANGVVDLSTGDLRAARPSDHFRIHAPTDWLGLGYAAPRWEGLVAQVFAGKPEMISFFRRLCGYAISGDRREQVLPILWGKGSNGKSTIMDAIAHVLGDDLCFTTQSDVLLERGIADGNAARPFVTAMRDKRLVLISESREGSRLNTGLIKQLTGDEKITARGLYSNPVSFRQTYQPMLVTNHRPQFPDGGDEAIWRRVRLVPFTESFVDEPRGPHEHRRERDLLNAVREEASGILAWLVRGCVEWHAGGGLNPPPDVVVSTDEYRRDEDPVRQFMDDCLMTGDGLQVTVSDVRHRYEAWCEDQGREPVSPRTLSRRLTERYGETTTARIGPKIRRVYQDVGVTE